MRRASVEIPSRELLLRDGIPPAVMAKLRDEAKRLRQETFAAAFRRLAQLLMPVPRRPALPARLYR